MITTNFEAVELQRRDAMTARKLNISAESIRMKIAAAIDGSGTRDEDKKEDANGKGTSSTLAIASQKSSERPIDLRRMDSPSAIGQYGGS